MITGGTGSFGNAVLDRFLKTDIGEIRIFSRDEKKQDDMRHKYQAEMPEVAAMVSAVLKKNKVDAEAAIKLARPISSTILAFEKKNGSKDLNDFDAELYSKLCSDFEHISALKGKADTIAQKIVDGYHNC